MPEQLNYELKEAIQNYYMHRQRQSRNGWDKEQDLDLIFQVASREGWTVEAVAGHFWFSRKVLFGTHIIEVTEKTLPYGGLSNIANPGDAYGFIAMFSKYFTKKPIKSADEEPKEENYI